MAFPGDTGPGDERRLRHIEVKVIRKGAFGIPTSNNQFIVVELSYCIWQRVLNSIGNIHVPS